MSMSNFPEGVVDVVSILVDEDENNLVYPIDVLHGTYQLYSVKVPVLSRSKFQNFFLLVKVVLSISHTNAGEELLFSPVTKNLTAQRASIALDGTLSSIVPFQLNHNQGKTCIQYQSTKESSANCKQLKERNIES